MDVELVPTTDRENFIVNLQAAFNAAFGGDEEIIPREEIEKSFAEAGAEILDIVSENKIVGGAVVVIRPNNRNSLDLFYVNVDNHSRGIGLAAWQAIEARYPQTKVWETVTPYFEKRNLHFYINKCGFHVVEFFNPKHPNPRLIPDQENFAPGTEYLFRFEKDMRK